MKLHPVVCPHDLTHRWHCIQPPKPFWHHTLKKWLMNLNSLFMLEIFDTNCKGWQRHSTIERSYEYLIPRSLRDTLVMHTCDYSLSYNRQLCDTGQPGNILPCQCVVKHGVYHLILISLYFGKSLKISVS